MTAVAPVVAVVAVLVGVLAVVGPVSIAVPCLPVLAGLVRAVRAVAPTVGVIRPAALPPPATFTTVAGNLAITLVPLPRAVFCLPVSARFGRRRGRLVLDGR
ncbi:hypothetical protein [Streptomyces sp. NPDC058847]|uniref:hypothetical protein n=1 Tax=Streptomyces sp. NPDC058847 TaxID=3346649 RepID=UPI0036C3D954